MRKQLIAVAVAATGALLAVAPSLPASAASVPVLTVGSAGASGTPVNPTDTLTASLLSGTSSTLSTSSGNVTCTSSSFTATVTSNPASPGTADESLTAQTFGGCTAKISGVSSVKSVTALNLPYNAAVTDSNDTLTLTPGSGALEVSVVLNTVLGSVTCDYSASSLAGTVSNSNNSVTFTNQSTSLLSGPGVCPKNGTFSAAYGPIEDTTQGNGLVFVN